MRIGKLIDSTDVNEKLDKFWKFNDHFKTPADNITAVIGHYDELPSGNIEFWKEWRYTHNVVTNDGDEFYARRAQGTANTATNANFVAARLELATSGNSVAETNTYGYDTGTTNGGFSGWNGSAHADVIASTKKNTSSGYAKISDDDSDNSANSNVRTLAYKFEYATGDFNHTSISNGAVYDAAVTSPAAASKILTHFAFAAAFAKTANDTLKCFVNHTFNAA